MQTSLIDPQKLEKAKKRRLQCKSCGKLRARWFRIPDTDMIRCHHCYAVTHLNEQTSINIEIKVNAPKSVMNKIRKSLVSLIELELTNGIDYIPSKDEPKCCECDWIIN